MVIIHYRDVGDILENYCQKDDVMNAARFFFAATIMLTYPIECFVTREVYNQLIYADVKDLNPACIHNWIKLIQCCFVLATLMLSEFKVMRLCYMM